MPGFPHVLAYNEKRLEAEAKAKEDNDAMVAAGVALPKADATGVEFADWVKEFRDKHMKGEGLTRGFTEDITMKTVEAINSRLIAWKTGHSNSTQFNSFSTELFVTAARLQQQSML